MCSVGAPISLRSSGGASGRLAFLARLLGASVLPAAGRLDLLAARLALLAGRPGDRYVRLPLGVAVLAGESAWIDFLTLASVWVYGVYRDVDVAGAVVLDVGAHKGYAAAYALARGARHVVAFEPEPTNRRYLERLTASLPDPARLEVRPEAIDATDGEARLHLAAESWSHSILAPAADHPAASLTVPARALAGVVAETRRRFPAQRLVLKIDAEGAECRLLGDASALHALAAVAEVVFEYHDFAPCALGTLIGRLGDAGFAYAGGRSDFGAATADVHHVRRP